jgi:hypothetical protein
MKQAEVARFFAQGVLCVRAYDRITGVLAPFRPSRCLLTQAMASKLGQLLQKRQPQGCSARMQDAGPPEHQIDEDSQQV